MGSKPIKYEGLAKNVSIHLAPRITMTRDVYVTPEDSPLMLVGNDVFNPEMVKVEGILADKQAWVLSWNGQHDVLPFQL